MEDPLAFNVDWYDAASGLKRNFILSFYESDNSVEMFDVKLRRLFLKRARLASISKRELYVGNTIVVYARQLVITDYANEKTRQLLANAKQSVLILVLPDKHRKTGHIIDSLERAGHALGRARTLRFTPTTAAEFFESKLTKLDQQKIKQFMCQVVDKDPPTFALEIVGPGIVGSWTSCLRPSLEFDGDIRESIDELAFHGIYGSSRSDEAERDLGFVFESGKIPAEPRPSEIFPDDATCCMVKPHVVREGRAGRIVDDIQQSGFHIFALQTFMLDKKAAGDFFEIYKGIPGQNYAGMVNQASSGRCLVLALSKDANSNFPLDNAVDAFRKLCGPHDPEVCRALFPDSIRAKYGEPDAELNAVHCSDLAEDGLLEVEYFFGLIQCYE